METLIIPTDFSEAADNAMHFGVQLAREVNASVVLLHVYQLPVSMNDIPVMMLSGDELKKSTEEGLGHRREALQQQYPGTEIRAESRLGDVRGELTDLCAEVKPLAVVIGSQNASGLERVLFGSTAIELIRKLHYPVIAVPPKTAFAPVRHLLLATDLKNVDRVPVPVIHQFTERFGAQLHLVHVHTGDETEAEKRAAQQLTGLFGAAAPDFHEVRGEEIAEGITGYAQQTGAGMIVCIPHQHSVLEHFFFRTHSEAVLRRSQLPVLFLPER